MDTERRFRRIFVAFLIPFVAIRIIFRIILRMRQPEPQQRQPATASAIVQRWKQLTTYEDRLSVVARIALGPLLIMSVWRYFKAPQQVERYAVRLPVWLRWVGAGLGFASLPLLAWTHQTLDRAWSTNLELQDQHTLVTGGPYRWVRHPMYTAVLAFFVGSALVSANGVIIAPAGVSSWVVLARMGDEEAMMMTQFGEAYRAYMARTGRLLPTLPLHRGSR